MENDDMRSALAKWLAGLDGRRQNKRNIAGLLEVAFQRIDALKARVEAAEAEAAEWKAAYADNELYGLALMQRRDELAARVAELEATLAAQGWRPMTDYPANGQEVDLIVPATYYQAEVDPFTAEMMLAGYYLSDDGDMLRTLPTHWRPRRSPPTAAEATE